MFNRLRLKLTFINVAVTAVLFAVLICGVYTLLHYNSSRATDYFLNRISEKVAAGQLADLPPRIASGGAKQYPGFIPPPPRPNFFFIKVTAAGAPFMLSNGLTITSAQVEGLLDIVRKQSGDRGQVNYLHAPFAYQKTTLPNGSGDLFVFNDLSDERAAMNELLTNLLYVGLFCMLLCFIASFCMANQAIKPIRRALIQQKNFVSDASHELRTPITIIQTNLDILRGAPPGDTLDANRKWIDNMQNETSRMIELINSLLFLARADANHQPLEKEYFSLNQAIADAVEPFLVLADAKSLTLTADTAEQLPALGDPARISQALTILLDNALRHTPRQGKITVFARREGNELCLSVSDTGEGIAPEHLDKIFDRFYQADDSRNRGGAGLGLAMAKWIVEQHRGTIAAASTLNRGTTITIHLPAPDVAGHMHGEKKTKSHAKR